jgi:hypothetical protein
VQRTLINSFWGQKSCPYFTGLKFFFHFDGHNQLDDYTAVSFTSFNVLRLIFQVSNTTMQEPHKTKKPPKHRKPTQNRKAPGEKKRKSQKCNKKKGKQHYS